LISRAGDYLQGILLGGGFGKIVEAKGFEPDLPVAEPIGLILEALGDIEHIPGPGLQGDPVGGKAAAALFNVGQVVPGGVGLEIVIVMLADEGLECQVFGEKYIFHRFYPAKRWRILPRFL